MLIWGNDSCGENEEIGRGVGENLTDHIHPGLEARNKQQQEQGRPREQKWWELEAGAQHLMIQVTVPGTVIHWAGRAEGLPAGESSPPLSCKGFIC